MSKELRRKRAKEKERMTKLALTVVGGIVAGLVVGFILMGVLGGDDDDRVFLNAGASITLREDGTFLALLPHNVRLNGTFAETEAPAGTTVSFEFNHNGVDRNDVGTIRGNALIAPDEWDSGCAHGHGMVYILR
ncbi:MAG: hypothetical protein FWF77_08195 [Defluviitaleaceae bacterium]|nr:hypothetical protein [Defluviitaleaceae bacterium]